ncbi:DUF4160 domain-containing protein [Cellvibrio sp.]|uniref:DUF4160 domain-containing protein n=1 Tax=Cellvibrio sp. TaxID=1965322 RepID=UPI003964831E
MPVILRLNGFRFFFYSNEGNPLEPAHIHVSKDGDEAKIWLDLQLLWPEMTVLMRAPCVKF